MVFILSAGQARGAHAPGQEAAVATQEQPKPAAEGYVTAVSPPDGFTVNGVVHVTTTTATTYQWLDNNETENTPASNNDIQIGALVQVKGTVQGGVLSADAVRLRNLGDKTLEGFGVIDKVVAAGPEPVFQADGYRIRILSTTETKFGHGLNALGDVGTNIWIRYRGKRNKKGELEATRAVFLKARPGKAEPAPSDALPTKPSMIDSYGHVFGPHTKVRLADAGWCGLHRISMDQALQERVRRVGMKVIPAYQKQMPDSDPSKIHFRIYVVDEPKIREDLECSEGVILVPLQVVARLSNDDQLAAVMANAMAFSLMIQAADFGTNGALERSAEITDTVLFLTGGYLLEAAAEPVFQHEILIRLREQAGRMALAFMQDAGYDPWVAPEVWRLLGPKDLPTDLNSLKYPDRAGYQLAILNLQYPHPKNAAADANGTETNSPQAK